jgi:hypothetical protein
MAKRGSICIHPAYMAIACALLGGSSLRPLTAIYWPSLSALSRHPKPLRGALATAVEAAPQAHHAVPLKNKDILARFDVRLGRIHQGEARHLLPVPWAMSRRPSPLCPPEKNRPSLPGHFMGGVPHLLRSTSDILRIFNDFSPQPFRFYPGRLRGGCGSHAERDAARSPTSGTGNGGKRQIEQHKSAKNGYF